MDEVVTMVIGALIAGAVVGFGLGFFGFKVRTRWCRHHGAVLRCPECQPDGARRSRRPRLAGS